MNRRDFNLWLGMGLLGLNGRLIGQEVESLAGVSAEPESPAGEQADSETPAAEIIEPARVVEHWRAAKNDAWRWLERCELVEGVWALTGMTMPVDRQTGYQISGRDCAYYLPSAEAPHELVRAVDLGQDLTDFCVAREGAAAGPAATPQRRTRQGRPPSLWARNLKTSELRAWLSSFEPPEAGVGGMTFLEHLTRDHGFDTAQIEHLSEAEQAKLHGAAHHGY